MVKREKHENSLKNLKMFSSSYQPSGKAKSEGKRKAQTMRELANLFGAGEKKGISGIKQRRNFKRFDCYSRAIS